MKQFLAMLLLMLALTSVYSQSQKIDLTGFGEIPSTKNGDQYSVTFADYKTFNLTGSLNLLNPESKITIE